MVADVASAKRFIAAAQSLRLHLEQSEREFLCVVGVGLLDSSRTSIGWPGAPIAEATLDVRLQIASTVQQRVPQVHVSYRGVGHVRLLAIQLEIACLKTPSRDCAIVNTSSEVAFSLLSGCSATDLRKLALAPAAPAVRSFATRTTADPAALDPAVSTPIA